jgi:hypothetical protein
MKRLIFIVFILSVFVAAGLSAQNNSNSVGIWRIHEFVDEFGDKTGEKFISTGDFIRGTFSNSAIKDGQLRAVPIISRQSFGFQFYEDYFRANNVASTFIIINSATVSVRDKDGNTLRLRGTTPEMSGQRLYIAPFVDIISALKKGGLVRFSINIDNINVYRFDISNADGFDRAFEQIGGSAAAAQPGRSGYQQMGLRESQ